MGNTYFEIKSATTEFEMSINEYESMKENKENYYIVLVDRKSNTISMHQFAEVEKLKKPSGYIFEFTQLKRRS